MPIHDESQTKAQSFNIKKIYKKPIKEFIGLSVFLILFIEAFSIFLFKNYHETYMKTMQLMSFELIILILASNLLFFSYYLKKKITIKVACICFMIVNLLNIIIPFLDLHYKTYLFLFQSLSIGSGLGSLLIGGISWRMKSRV
ncbi:hypothetical protein [uncultured Mediterranean phage uvMED]|nr:hypothetical protein [uncultured Mediterranean phage uvMED]